MGFPARYTEHPDRHRRITRGAAARTATRAAHVHRPPPVRVFGRGQHCTGGGGESPVRSPKTKRRNPLLGLRERQNRPTSRRLVRMFLAGGVPRPRKSPDVFFNHGTLNRGTSGRREHPQLPGGDRARASQKPAGTFAALKALAADFSSVREGQNPPSTTQVLGWGSPPA